MNLISCGGCGVVLDREELEFPDNIYLKDGCVDFNKAAYHDHVDDHVAIVKCPVCKADIFKY